MVPRERLKMFPNYMFYVKPLSRGDGDTLEIIQDQYSFQAKVPRTRLNSPLRKCRFQFGVGSAPMRTIAAHSPLTTANRPNASAASVCTTKMKAYAASAASLGVP